MKCQNELCQKEFPISIIIDGKRRVLNKRKYCLECTPFGSHNTKIFVNGERISPNTEYNKKRRNQESNKYTKYDWPAIQKFYDNGGTWREIIANFKITNSILAKAVKQGLIKTIKNRITDKMWKHKHTNESKQKLREARLKYLAKHPEESSWRAVQGKESAPEKFVKNFLNKMGVEFVSEFKPLLHKNRYFCMDISFLNHKIAWEINGGQHYDTNGKLKPYYQKRHDLIESEGWRLIEIPYWDAFKEDVLIRYLNMFLPVEKSTSPE